MARATSIFHSAKSVRRQPNFSPLDKSRRFFLGAFLALVILASACAIFYIGTHVQAVNLGYKLSQELQRKEHLIEENKRLDLEIARLKSPIRIEEEAKATLGLVLPPTQQVFYLSRWDEELSQKLAAPPQKTPPPAKALAKLEDKAPGAKALPKKPPQKPEVASAKPKASSPEKAAAQKPELAKRRAEPALALKKPSESPAKTAAAPAPAKALAKTTEKAEAVKPKATAPALALQKVETPPAATAKPVAASKRPAAPAPLREKTAAKTPPAKAKATAKNEAPQAPQSRTEAAKPSADVKPAKQGQVLVARIVEKNPVETKTVKPKTGPALAYQPKEKVPAVMLDPMP